MPFIKGNAIGRETRFKTGESGNPAGRPADSLRKRIEAELEKFASLHRPANAPMRDICTPRISWVLDLH